MFQIGNTQFEDVYLGSQRLESVYIGNNKIFPIEIIPEYYDTFDDGSLDGWQYDETAGYSLSNNGNKAHISGNGLSVNPTGQKEFDISAFNSLILSFDWRAKSTLSVSTVTNFRMKILDDSNNILLSESLQSGGTLDTGIKSYSKNISDIVTGYDKIIIQMYLNDSWGANWNQKIWWDNVHLREVE